MKRHRQLRKLVPDDELLRRRAAGVPLRELASDYGVAHTTLGRYFARPQVALEVKALVLVVRRERREDARRQANDRRLQREAIARIRQQAARNREEERLYSRPLSPPPRRRTDYERWLDERDRWRPPTRRERHTANDQLASDVVAAGGGLQEVVEATGLRTTANVFKLVDPEILVIAFENDGHAESAVVPSRERLRKLVPNNDLIERRAAGASGRQLAGDYGVTHTTLYRYFQRPDVAAQLRKTRRRRIAGRPQT